MATQDVTVPSQNSDQATRHKPIDIDTHIETPKDVHFVNEGGDDAYVNYINTAADGTVELLPLGGTDPDDLVQVYLVKGGWHECPFTHEIKGDDGNTDDGLKIRVRL